MLKIGFESLVVSYSKFQWFCKPAVPGQKIQATSTAVLKWHTQVSPEWARAGKTSMLWEGMPKCQTEVTDSIWMNTVILSALLFPPLFLAIYLLTLSLILLKCFLKCLLQFSSNFQLYKRNYWSFWDRNIAGKNKQQHKICMPRHQYILINSLPGTRNSIHHMVFGFQI